MANPRGATAPKNFHEVLGSQKSKLTVLEQVFQTAYAIKDGVKVWLMIGLQNYSF